MSNKETQILKTNHDFDAGRSAQLGQVISLIKVNIDECSEEPECDICIGQQDIIDQLLEVFSEQLEQK